MFQHTIPSSVVFNTLRVLKKANPGDLYYEAYVGHWRQHKEKFMDTYHVMWQIATEFQPRRILEIGVRTGLSISQLLSGYIHEQFNAIERVVLCDLFNDGFCSPGLVRYNLMTLAIPKEVIDKIEFLSGDSKSKIPEFIGDNPDQKFDYILVDGSHDKDDARHDLSMCHDILDVGGFMLFDDISPTGVMLKDVWDEFKAEHRQEYDWFEDYNGKGVGVGRRVATTNAVCLSEEVV